MLYTLSLHNAICQSYLDKTERLTQHCKSTPIKILHVYLYMYDRSLCCTEETWHNTVHQLDSNKKLI